MSFASLKLLRDTYARIIEATLDDVGETCDLDEELLDDLASRWRVIAEQKLRAMEEQHPELRSNAPVSRQDQLVSLLDSRSLGLPLGGIGQNVALGPGEAIKGKLQYGNAKGLCPMKDVSFTDEPHLPAPPPPALLDTMVARSAGGLLASHQAVPGDPFSAAPVNLIAARKQTQKPKPKKAYTPKRRPRAAADDDHDEYASCFGDDRIEVAPSEGAASEAKTAAAAAAPICDEMPDEQAKTTKRRAMAEAKGSGEKRNPAARGSGDEDADNVPERGDVAGSAQVTATKRKPMVEAKPSKRPKMGEAAVVPPDAAGGGDAAAAMNNSPVGDEDADDTAEYGELFDNDQVIQTAADRAPAPAAEEPARCPDECQIVVAEQALDVGEAQPSVEVLQLNSDDDVSEFGEVVVPHNHVYGKVLSFEKRRKRWVLELCDGLLNIDGQECLFSSANIQLDT